MVALSQRVEDGQDKEDDHGQHELLEDPTQQTGILFKRKKDSIRQLGSISHTPFLKIAIATANIVCHKSAIKLPQQNSATYSAHNNCMPNFYIACPVEPFLSYDVDLS